MWMIELATNTTTAETTIGSHRDITRTITTSYSDWPQWAGRTISSTGATNVGVGIGVRLGYPQSVSQGGAAGRQRGQSRNKLFRRSRLRSQSNTAIQE